MMFFAESDITVMVEKFGTMIVAIITAIGLLIGQIANYRKLSASKQEIADKIDVANEVTHIAKEQTIQEVKSAAKVVTEQAKGVAIITKQAAEKAKEVAVQTAESTQAALTDLGHKLNGSAGLVASIEEHATRLTAVEGRIDHVDKTVMEILAAVKPDSGAAKVIRENG